MSLQLTDAQLAAVRQILGREPAVLVFGSRASGDARPFSDLDICLRRPEPIPDAEIGGLREAFQESDLPFKVDLVDFHRVEPAFRELILKTGKPL